MNVSKEQLLHKMVQIVVQVLLLHADQLQFVHGKIQSFGAFTAVLFSQQIIAHILLPGTIFWDKSRTRLVHQLTEFFGHCFVVAYDLYAAELVVGLGAPADDPGRLPEPYLATYDQGVDGVRAAIATVVELIGLERVVVVEPVRSRDELWACSNLAAVGGKKAWKQNFSKLYVY